MKHRYLTGVLFGTFLAVGQCLAGGSAFEDALGAAGWEVTQDAAGNLVLRPGPSLQASSAPSSKEGAGGDRWAPLRAKGWRVIEAPDGTVSLYPPASAEAVASPASSAGKGPVGASEAPCAGVRVDSGVSLPVDTWAKVHRLALAWIARRGDHGLAVGRIRHVLRVYLVSIVEKRPPHRLRHQIVVRRRDGRVILVD